MPAPAPALLPAFTAEVHIIGVNPYVFLPEATLKKLFTQAGKEKGSIPVRGTLDGYPFTQTLVKYSGHWRLYLNGPMRKAAGKDVGDPVRVRIAFDPTDRSISMHPALDIALKEHPEAAAVFVGLSPSRKKEIVRYISRLKSAEALERNVARAIGFLLKKERFVGRDRP